MIPDAVSPASPATPYSSFTAGGSPPLVVLDEPEIDAIPPKAAGKRVRFPEAELPKHTPGTGKVAQKIREQRNSLRSRKTKETLTKLQPELLSRLENSNIEEIIEYLFFIKTKEKNRLLPLILLKKIGEEKEKYAMLTLKVMEVYQAIIDEPKRLEESVLLLSKQPKYMYENRVLLDKAVESMIEVYKNCLLLDPIDELDKIFIKLNIDEQDDLKSILQKSFYERYEGFTYLSQKVAQLLREKIIINEKKVPQPILIEALEKTLQKYETYRVDVIRLLNQAWQEVVNQLPKDNRIFSGQIIVLSVKCIRLLQSLVTEPNCSSALSGITSCLALIDQHGGHIGDFMNERLRRIEDTQLQGRLSDTIVLELTLFFDASEQFAAALELDLLKNEREYERMNQHDTVSERFFQFLRTLAGSRWNMHSLLEHAWFEVDRVRKKYDYVSFSEHIIMALKARCHVLQCALLDGVKG